MSVHTGPFSRVMRFSEPDDPTMKLIGRLPRRAQKVVHRVHQAWIVENDRTEYIIVLEKGVQLRVHDLLCDETIALVCLHA